MIERIIEIITDNMLLSVGLALLVAYFVFGKVKKYLAKKKMKQKKEDEARLIKIKAEDLQREEQRNQEQQKVQEEEQKKMEEIKKEEKNYIAYDDESDDELLKRAFSNIKEEPKKELIRDELDSLSKNIANNADELTKKMQQEKEDLKQELLETTKKKREIQKRGMELAQLFDLYKEREEQLIQRLRK